MPNPLLEAITGLVWDKNGWREKKDKYKVDSGLTKGVDMGDAFQRVHDTIKDFNKNKKTVLDLYNSLVALEGDMGRYKVELAKSKSDAKFIKVFDDQLILVTARMVDIRAMTKSARTLESLFQALEEESVELRGLCEIYAVHAEKDVAKRGRLTDVCLVQLSNLQKERANAFKTIIESLRTPETIKISVFDPKKTKILWEKMTLDDFVAGLRAIVHGSPDHTSFGKALVKAIKDCGFWKAAEQFAQAAEAVVLLAPDVQTVSRSFSKYSSFLKDTNKEFLSTAELEPLVKELNKADAIVKTVKAELPKLTKIPEK